MFVSIGHDVEDGLVIIASWLFVRLPRVNLSHRSVIEWGDLLDRGAELSVGIQKGWAKIAVIERFVFFRIIALVGQGIVDGEILGAGFRAQFGGNDEANLFRSHQR